MNRNNTTILWIICIAGSGFLFRLGLQTKCLYCITPRMCIIHIRVLCRTFHTVRSQIQIPIPTAEYGTGLGLESGSESTSVNINKLAIVHCEVLKD